MYCSSLLYCLNQHALILEGKQSHIASLHFKICSCILKMQANTVKFIPILTIHTGTFNTYWYTRKHINISQNRDTYQYPYFWYYWLIHTIQVNTVKYVYTITKNTYKYIQYIQIHKNTHEHKQIHIKILSKHANVHTI